MLLKSDDLPSEVCTLVLQRPCRLVNFGFTLRHVIVYPPKASQGPVSDNGKRCAVQTAVVSCVEIGSIAHLAGLRPNQRILAVNELSVFDRPYISIVQQIANSETELSLMIVVGGNSDGISSPSASPAPTDSLSSRLTNSPTSSSSTSVTIPQQLKLNGCYNNNTDAGRLLNMADADREGRISRLLAEMYPHRATPLSSSSAANFHNGYANFPPSNGAAWYEAGDGSSGLGFAANHCRGMRSAYSQDDFVKIRQRDDADDIIRRRRNGDSHQWDVLPASPSSHHHTQRHHHQLNRHSLPQAPTSSVSLRQVPIRVHNDNSPASQRRTISSSVSENQLNGQSNGYCNTSAVLPFAAQPEPVLRRAQSTGLWAAGSTNSRRPVVKKIPPPPSYQHNYNSNNNANHLSLAGKALPSIQETDSFSVAIANNNQHNHSQNGSSSSVSIYSAGRATISPHSSGSGRSSSAMEGHRNMASTAKIETVPVVMPKSNGHVATNGGVGVVTNGNNGSAADHGAVVCKDDSSFVDHAQPCPGNNIDMMNHIIINNNTRKVSNNASEISPPQAVKVRSTPVQSPLLNGRRSGAYDWGDRLLLDGGDTGDGTTTPTASSTTAAVNGTGNGVNGSASSSLTRRYTTRQPSFVAAINGTQDSNGNFVPGGTNGVCEDAGSVVSSVNHAKQESTAEQQQSVVTRRPRARRPKSYVMATTSEQHQPTMGNSDVSSAFASAVAASNAHRSVSKDHCPQQRDQAPHPPAAQRIHRFITFFSAHDQNQPSVTASKPTDNGHKGSPHLRTYRSEGVYKVPLGQSGKSVQSPSSPMPTTAVDKHRLSWGQCWAVLHKSTLYLCKELSSYTSADTGEKVLNIPADSQSVDVVGAIVDISYDDPGRLHVLRLTTQRRTDHLLQAACADDMLSWIERLQSTSSVVADGEGAGENGTTQNGNHSNNEVVSTTELIMQRYKAKSSQIASPNPPKRPGGGKAGDDPTDQPSTSQHQSTSTLGSKEGEGTPKTGRKWKKQKKSRAESSSSLLAKGGGGQPVVATSALGNKIADCPTSGDGDLVPLLVQLCVKVVEAHGMETVGIYRIPGNTAAVNALRDNLTQGFENVDFSDPRWKDVNVVSSLLKMFLRQVPEPLLTDKLYPFFINANRINGHTPRLRKIRQLVRKLPKSHFATLKYIIAHLNTVVQQSHVNKMEVRNLALMFGPSIVRPSDGNMATMVTHMSDQCRLIETLINYCDWIFDETGADDDPPEEIMVPVASNSDGVQMTNTFSDMQDLLRRVNQNDEDAEKSKDNIVRTILNVRRNSKKEKSGRSATSKLSPRVNADASKQRSHSDKPVTVIRAAGVNSANQQQPTISLPQPMPKTAEAAIIGSYQERDIDAEVAARCSQNGTNKSPGRPLEPVSVFLSSDHINDGSSATSESTPNSLDRLSPALTAELEPMSYPLTRRTSPRKNDLENAVAEMRRKRQQRIYSARRMFMSGSGDLPEAGTGINDSPEMQQRHLDELVSHTRHLNLTGLSQPALDVLSPETREKIRRMQVEGQLRQLKYKEQKQDAELKQVEHALQLAKRAYDEARGDVDCEDPLDTLPDTASLTSDYSTTSSLPLTTPIAGGHGGLMTSSLTVLRSGADATHQPPSSDYASSSNVSPADREQRHSASLSPSLQRTTAGYEAKSGVGCRLKPWYESADEEMVTTSGGSTTGHSTVTPVVQSPTNGAAMVTPTKQRSSPPSVRTLTPNERAGSRISQKIRFRNKTADRRDDPRRHTLTDLDQVKAAFAAENGGANHEKPTNNNNTGGGGGGGGQKKMGRLAKWLKNSLRKSSPDITSTCTAAPTAIATSSSPSASKNELLCRTSAV